MTHRNIQLGKSGPERVASVKHGTPVSADEVHAELERILCGSAFATAEKMKDFLRFIVQETLAGRGDALNEALVGMEVYSRGETFDPRQDSIVRVEAGRLRSKLREFYESRADSGSIRIEIPKGSYKPVFRDMKGSAARKSARISHERFASKTMAVLPFADMSPQRDHEYFGDGLAEEMMFALSRLRNLRVVSQTSVFAFKGKAIDVREIGRQLDVEYIMEGSVRKAEQQLRVSVRLTEVVTGFQIWSEVFERTLTLKDIFEVQQQISKAVAGALRIAVLGEEEDLPGHCSTKSLSAFNHFSVGRSHWNKQTQAALLAAIGHFEKAVAEDPGYGRAYFGIADSLRKLEFWGLMRPADALPKAKEAARKAVSVEPTLVEANIPLAAIRAVNEWEWAEAEAMLRGILATCPDSAHAHQVYAMMCLLPLGRFDEAIEQIHTARELDPLALLTNAHVGGAYYFASRYDEAIEQLQSTLELEPNYHLAHLGLAISLQEKGLLNDAIATIEKAKSLAGEIMPIWGALGNMYARAGRTREAESVLEELFALQSVRYISPLDFALVYGGLGRTDQAVECLQKAAAEHCGRLPWSLMDPRHKNLRSDGRFQELSRRVFSSR